MSTQVITLLSDLGANSISVTAIKAAMMVQTSEALVVDVSHDIDQYDLQQAAYAVLSSRKAFPQGTIHVILVDVAWRIPSRVLLAEVDGSFFVAPDNGILHLAFGSGAKNIRICHEFATSFTFNQWAEKVAQVAKTLLIGQPLSFEESTPQNEPRPPQPNQTLDSIECNILYVDRYSNVVLNIKREEFERITRNRGFRIKTMRANDIYRVSDNYADVAPGEPLCRFNETGFLEIASNHGNAASSLGLNPVNISELRYKTVKIALVPIL